MRWIRKTVYSNRYGAGCRPSNTLRVQALQHAPVPDFLAPHHASGELLMTLSLRAESSAAERGSPRPCRDGGLLPCRFAQDNSARPGPQNVESCAPCLTWIAPALQDSRFVRRAERGRS